MSLDGGVVVACAEKASLLLVAQATLALMQLAHNPRDQTRLKMALQDEMVRGYMLAFIQDEPDSHRDCGLLRPKMQLNI